MPTVEAQMIASSNLSSGTVEALLLDPNTGVGGGGTVIVYTDYIQDIVLGSIEDQAVSGSIIYQDEIFGSLEDAKIDGESEQNNTLEGTWE